MFARLESTSSQRLWQNISGSVTVLSFFSKGLSPKAMRDCQLYLEFNVFGRIQASLHCLQRKPVCRHLHDVRLPLCPSNLFKSGLIRLIEFAKLR